MDDRIIRVPEFFVVETTPTSEEKRTMKKMNEYAKLTPEEKAVYLARHKKYGWFVVACILLCLYSPVFQVVFYPVGVWYLYKWTKTTPPKQAIMYKDLTSVVVPYARNPWGSRRRRFW